MMTTHRENVLATRLFKAVGKNRELTRRVRELESRPKTLENALEEAKRANEQLTNICNGLTKEVRELRSRLTSPVSES